MNNPIFIHSLFRAGSTYMFNVFRRSSAGYWCYQEPLHELAVFANDDPNLLFIDHGEEKTHLLRHPPIETSYFLELHDTWPVWKDVLNASAVYNGYFSPPDFDIGIPYWRALIEAAKDRPVFQECRTSGRIGAIKKQLGGYHIYLWRNPWDQWFSYKVTPYFDAANQLIINASNPPPVVQMLKNALKLEAYQNDDLGGAFEYYSSRPLDSEGSYLVFYLLWCLGLQTGISQAHLVLNIDSLSTSPTYRSDVEVQLTDAGIDGLDFFDCLVSQSYYLEQDKVFFMNLEGKVHHWLIEAGWQQKDLDRLQCLRQQFQPAILTEPIESLNPQDMAEHASRVRTLIRRFETSFAVKSNECMLKVTAAEARARQAEAKIHQSETKAGQAEAKSQEAEMRAGQAEAKSQEAEMRAVQAEAKAKETHNKAQEAETRAGQAEAKAQEADNKAQEAETKAQESETRAVQAEALLAAIYNSRLWRITTPWRWTGNVARWLVQASIAWLTFAPGSRPRRILRSLLIAIKEYISSHLHLKAVMKKLLSPFPHLYEHLRLVGRSLSAVQPGIFSSMGNGIERIEDLSPRARKIYSELKAAIEQRQNEQR